MEPSPLLPVSLVERLRAVRSCGVITGAGVSRESGLRTWRGKGGRFEDPLHGYRTIDALSAATLADDPDRTWDAIAELGARVLAAEPNAAHRALVAIEERLRRFVLLTQNTDGLHQRAGSRQVVELHGNLFHTQCPACGETGRLAEEDLARLGRAPRCTACGGILRPEIVLFGELLPLERVEALLEEFYLHPPDLLIVAGTSASFTYITEPVLFAQKAGRLVVEINPEVTALTDQVAISLRGSAGAYLPALARALGATAVRDRRTAWPRSDRDLEAG